MHPPVGAYILHDVSGMNLPFYLERTVVEPILLAEDFAKVDAEAREDGLVV